MVLVDWEKAFDKVDRETLFIALERMGVDEKIIIIVRSLYKETEFYVEMEGIASNKEKQETGIRQGCPSPHTYF